jgi:hypothetical protein
LSLIFDVKGKTDDSAIGFHAESRLSQSVLPEEDRISALDEIRSLLTKVQCLVVKDHTAWWSGTITFATPDPRQNDATNAQILDNIANREQIQFGRLTDNPPEPQVRSLFGSGPIVAEVPLNDPGTINSNNAVYLGASGKDICRKEDALFDGNANYLQVASDPERNTATIIWLDPAGTVQLSGPIDVNSSNAAQVLGNPPTAALYSLRDVTRTFSAGRVVIHKG